MNRLAFALRVVLRGAPDLAPQVWRSPRFVCPTPEENPMAGPDGREVRADAAMSLMDDDVHGFVMCRIVKAGDQPVDEIDVIGWVADSAWPAMHATIQRVAAVGAERAW